MKVLKIIFLILICNLQFTISNHLFAQCQPMIIIDGNNIIADENASSGLKLPAWLKAGQTLNIGQYVYSISVIEFTVNGTTLDYSQNLSITSSSTVPASKVWKIEAVNKNATLPTFSGSYTYTTPGTYTFTAPPCISTARVQIWGAGGGGGSGDNGGCWLATGSAGGGGGGGYAEGFYQLTASGSYTITVGAGGIAGTTGSGGAGGSTSVGTISITVPGGAGGTAGSPGVGGVGGTGGTGSGQLNFAGETGGNGTWGGNSGKGGDAANGGGIGGALKSFSTGTGNPGTAPGGGGGGGSYSNCATGGAGAAGKVIITFGASTSTTTSTTIIPGSGSLQFSRAILVNTTLQTVPTGKVWEIKSFLPYNDNQYTYVNINSTYGCANPNQMSYFKINGNNYPAPVVGGGNTTYLGYLQLFPIWIPAGTTVQSGCTNALVSIVEWTVVP